MLAASDDSIQATGNTLVKTLMLGGMGVGGEGDDRG